MGTLELALAVLVSDAPDGGMLLRSFGKDVAFDDLGPPRSRSTTRC